MDDGEVAVLAAGLGKAMSDGLSANEETKRKRVEAERVAAKRSQALRSIINEIGCDRKCVAEHVVDSVSRYCDEARNRALESLVRDSRMPRIINYLERYSVLVGIQDRQTVLKRLLDTIDLADEILESVNDIDVESAMRTAATSYVEGVLRLNGIQVCEADPVLTDFNMEANGLVGFSEAPGALDVSLVIEEAFASVFGGATKPETQQIETIEADKGCEKAIEKQIDEAKAKAKAAAMCVCRQNAMSMAGTVFAIDQPSLFEGPVIVKAAKDVKQIRELSTEVRRSFETFTQVVQDNGLFAAFAGENAYGACKGFHSDWWWDDSFCDEFEGEIPGRQMYDDIPTAIEEDKGGDTVEKSIERMRLFNKKKYWGMLDDDFQEHVEAFWYGFKKLMVNVNGLFEIDSRAFDLYCGSVREAAMAKAQTAGMLMDAYQAGRFCEEVSQLVEALCGLF